MARKGSSKNANSSSSNAFEFIWVDWTDNQLASLKLWLSNDDSSLLRCIQALVDQQWKVSISENQRSGRCLVSLTDKGGRKGCAGRCWGIEHSDVESAILAGYYYAIEIIGSSWDGNEARTPDDLW